MALDLYYSYSRNLTEDEIVSIDKKVFRNREAYNKAVVSKMLQDFINLEPIIQTFSDIHFRALVLFPNVKVLPRGRISIVSMTLSWSCA